MVSYYLAASADWNEELADLVLDDWANHKLSSQRVLDLVTIQKYGSSRKVHRKRTLKDL